MGLEGEACSQRLKVPKHPGDRRSKAPRSVPMVTGHRIGFWKTRACSHWAEDASGHANRFTKSSSLKRQLFPGIYHVTPPFSPARISAGHSPPDQCRTAVGGGLCDPHRAAPMRVGPACPPSMSSYDQKLEAKDGGLPHVVPTSLGFCPTLPGDAVQSSRPGGGCRGKGQEGEECLKVRSFEGALGRSCFEGNEGEAAKMPRGWPGPGTAGGPHITRSPELGQCCPSFT